RWACAGRMTGPNRRCGGRPAQQTTELYLRPPVLDTLHMGQEVAAKSFSREDRQQYRRKVRACLDVFARMLSEAKFHPERRSFGMEIELNLTDDAGNPAFVNAAALEAIANPDFQTELGRFNVEINIAPRLLARAVFSDLERDARA